MSAELELVKEYVQKRNPKHLVDVIAFTNRYFAEITWSLLKEEWTKMTFRERLSFCSKLWSELQ